MTRYNTPFYTFIAGATLAIVFGRYFADSHLMSIATQIMIAASSGVIFTSFTHLRQNQ